MVGYSDIEGKTYPEVFTINITYHKPFAAALSEHTRWTKVGTLLDMNMQ